MSAAPAAIPIRDDDPQAEVERRLVSACTSWLDEYPAVRELVSPSDIEDARSRIVFEAIGRNLDRIRDRDGAADFKVLALVIDECGDLASVGGASALAADFHGLEAVSSVALKLAREVRAASLQRMIRREAIRVSQDPDDHSAHERLVRFDAELRALRAGDSRSNAYRIVGFGDIQPGLDDDYLVKSLISRSTTNALIGAPGSSKTFLALDLSIAIASGTPWRGLRTKRGRVVYVAAEGARGIQNRLVAMRKRLALGDAPSVLFHLVPDVVRLTNDSDDVDRLLASIRDTLAGQSVDLVVIDTLSRAIAGRDENSSQDMTAAIAAADRIRSELGAAILLVHHSGKDETRGARGHSSLKAALDTEIEIRKTGETFEVTVTKSRDHEAGRKFYHRLEAVEIGIDGDDEPVTSCIVRPTEDAEGGPKPQLNANEQRTHEAIRALLAVAEGSGFDAPEAVLKTDLHSWVEKHCDVPRDLRRGVVNKGLKGLKSKGLVEVERGSVFLLRDA